MIPIASGVKVWIATGHTDMRRGMNSLALLVQEAFKRDPHAGDLYVFRGRVDQDSLARWARHVPVRKAARARPFHLAAGDGRRHFDLDVATRLHVGWNRLAQPSTNLAAIGGRLVRPVDSTR
jgi:IS66 Orf2 like protein